MVPVDGPEILEQALDLLEFERLVAGPAFVDRLGAVQLLEDGDQGGPGRVGVRLLPGHDHWYDGFLYIKGGAPRDYSTRPLFWSCSKR